ncbi:MAG: hypothetical protein AAB659_01880 [Patescibacteria group bacterium]
MFSLGGLFILVAVFYIYTYSEIVSVRHDIAKYESDLETIMVQNAGLKNQLYTMTDSSRLEALAVEQSMIYEKNPQWQFASQY